MKSNQSASVSSPISSRLILLFAISHLAAFGAGYARSCKIYGVATEKLIADGADSQMADVSIDVLKKLRDGLKASGDTPQYALDYAKLRGM